MGRACVVHLPFCFEETLCRTFHRCFLPNFNYFGQIVSEKNFGICHKQELPVAAILVVWLVRNIEICTGSPIHHSYKVTIHCFLVSEEKILLISKQKQELPITTMFFIQRGRNEEIVEMLPCKLVLYLAKWFQKIFRNRSTSNKNCLWRPCLLADRDEMSNINRGHSIDASYQVLVHLANQFQRRRFLEMDQLETRIAYGGLFVNASEWNEQYS